MLYEAIDKRHGIMLVGAPATGKTTVFKIMRDVAKILHNLEFKKRQNAYLKQKAIRLQIPFSVDEKTEVVKLETTDAKVNKMFATNPEEKEII